MNGIEILAVVLAAALTAALVALWRGNRKSRPLARSLEQVKQELAQLQRERNLLHILINSIPDQIYAKDKDNRFLVANQAVADALGIDKPELALGKTDTDFFPPDEAAKYIAEEKRVMSTAQSLLDELEPTVLKGRKVWLSTSKAPLHDEAGNIVGIVGINRDVSERRQAEEVLSKVVASARCILWDADVSDLGEAFNWQFRLHTSDETRKDLGLDRLPDERDGDMWVRHIPRKHLDQMDRTSLVALRSGEPGYQQEFPFVGGNGEEHWLKEDVRITRLRPGEYHLVGVCLDITDRKRAEATLRDRELLLRQVLDTNPNLIFVKDPDTRLILVNSAFASSYGESVERATGRVHAELHKEKGCPDEEMKQWITTDREVLLTGQSKTVVNRATRMDGSLHWHRTKKLPLVLANGRKAILVICEDITDLKAAEEELRKERDLLQALMDNIPDSIYFKDRESRFIRINAHKARGFGLNNPAEAVGKTDFDFYPEVDAKEYLADDKHIIAGERIIGKTEYHVTNGVERWSLTSKAPFFGPMGQITGIVGVSKDITYLKRMERQLADANEQLQRLARQDELTGLLNRRTLLELLENEWARWQRYGKPFSVFVIDADDFKDINDSYGHLAGDHALKLLSTILQQTVREVDVVGRYGGEEFVVLLPETTLEGARVAGEKILQSIRRAVLHWEGHTIHVTVSIGGAMSTLGDRDIDTLLHRADTALYTAKHNGKNQFVGATA